jgi:hypothetical protein
VLPPEGEELMVFTQGGIGNHATIDDNLQKLLNETRDIIESQDFLRVLSNGMTDLIDVFKGEMEHTFFETTPKPQKAISFEAGDDDSSDPISKSIPIAGVLPVMARTAHMITTGVPNPYLHVILAHLGCM